MTRREYLDVLQRALEGGAFAHVSLGEPTGDPEDRWAEIIHLALSIAGPPPDGLRIIPGWAWHVTPTGRRLGFALGKAGESRLGTAVTELLV